MTTFTDRLYIAKPEDGNVNWGDLLRANWGKMDHVFGPNDCYFVSPSFSNINLGNASATDQRHFSTIQAAITAAQEASANSERTIYILPGVYTEALTITGSVALVGMNPVVQPGGRGAGVRIQNPAATKGPVITVTPSTTHDTKVHLANLVLENLYNVAQTDGTFITEPFFVNCAKPTSYGTTTYHRLTATGVCFNGVTYGSNQRWNYGVKAEGNWKVILDQCELYGSRWTGGSDNGGIRFMTHVLGDVANSKHANIRINECRVESWYDYYSLGDVTHPVVAYGSNGSAIVHRCTMFVQGASSVGSYATDLTGGTNWIQGLNADDYEGWGNLLGPTSFFN